MSSDSKEMKRQGRALETEAQTQLRLGSPDGAPGTMVAGLAKVALGKLMGVAGAAKKAQDRSKGKR